MNRRIEGEPQDGLRQKRIAMLASRIAAEGEAEMLIIEEKRRKLAEEKGQPARTFAVKDPDAWNQIVQDSRASGIGMQTISYATRWASMMDEHIAQGKRLSGRLIENLSHEADLELMSGGSFGVARDLLIANWKHGPKLAAWYKLDQKPL